MKLGSCGLAVAALSASACSTLTKSETPAEAQSAKQENTEASVLLSGVADARIAAGDCGMILWTLDAERPLPVLRFVAGGRADIAINGAPVSLSLTGASGASGFGVYEEQTYESEGGVKMTVSVRFGQGFDGGAYLHRGLITLEQPDGWRSVTPAAGIAGCRG